MCIQIFTNAGSKGSPFWQTKKNKTNIDTSKKGAMIALTVQHRWNMPKNLGFNIRDCSELLLLHLSKSFSSDCTSRFLHVKAFALSFTIILRAATFWYSYWSFFLPKLFLMALSNRSSLLLRTTKSARTRAASARLSVELIKECVGQVVQLPHEATRLRTTYGSSFSLAP